MQGGARGAGVKGRSGKIMGQNEEKKGEGVKREHMKRRETDGRELREKLRAR